MRIQVMGQTVTVVLATSQGPETEQKIVPARLVDLVGIKTRNIIRFTLSDCACEYVSLCLFSSENES